MSGRPASAPDPGPRTGWASAIACSGVAALLAVVEIVWLLAFVDRSSDSAAFGMALVGTVVIPTLLAASVVAVVRDIRRRVRILVPAAVGASGLIGAGFTASVFVGDDPADPAWIHAVAAVPPVALFAAVVLVALVVRDVARRMRPAGRWVLIVVLAVVVPIVLALLLLTATPVIVLLALLAPLGFIGVAVLSSRVRVRA